MEQPNIIEESRWAWGQIKGQRRSFFANCAIGLARVLAALAFVWASKRIIDIATSKCEGDIFFWAALLALLVAARLGLYLIFLRYREKNRLEISNMLRSSIFSRVMSSRWSGKETLHTGDMVNRLEEDITTVCAAINDYVPTILVMAFQVICASAFLFTMQKHLLWVLLAIMPVALVVSKIYYKTLRKLNDDIRRKDSQIQSHLQESILKRALMLSMVKAADCRNKLCEMQEDLRESSIIRVNFSSRASFFVSLGFMAGYFVAFCWGAFGILEGTVTYGMMTAFLQLVSQVQNPIVNMSHQLPKLVQSFTSIDRLKEISDIPQEPEGDPLLMDGCPGIRVENLSFAYPGGSGLIIRKLSFDFAPGISTAIVGATGSGKSTLMRLILGLLEPQDGKVLICSGSQEMEMEPRLRCNFQYVPQGNSLLSGTVRQNLLLGKSDASDSEIEDALRAACADFVLSRKGGLDSECGEQGAGLSEGQAQRIAIARALLQPGKIMLMDEACSALDEDTERRILANLMERCKGRTIIWITHHEAVRKYMSNCLVMESEASQNEKEVRN